MTDELDAVHFPFRLGNTVYEYDYYSGSQCLVYFEDVLVDDTVRIAWNVEQSRTPIYGYASKYYNALAEGVIIAYGSIWIAFKEAAYLPIVLRHIASRRDEGSRWFATPARAPERGSEFSTSLLRSSQLWEGTGTEGGARQSGRVQRASIERMIAARERDRSSGSSGEGSQDGDGDRDLDNLLTQLGAMDDAEFENVAEMFEDAVWYGGNNPQDGRGDVLSGQFGGGEMTDEQALSYRRVDQFPPFDILVTFGDMNNSAANHTVHRIMSAEFVNTEFAGVDPTGDPVIVRHDFIARNVM
jgi:hypothetical protein